MIPNSTRLRRLCPGLLLFVLISIGTVHAAQVIDAKDGGSVLAKIAAREATRIKVDGAAITDVVGNIYSSNCGRAPNVSGTTQAGAGTAPAANPSGEVVLECDRDKGQIYVRPITADQIKPINLFISTAQATYTLILQPVDMPAETIVIRDRSVWPPQAANDTAGGRASSHVRALKTILFAMATNGPIGDMHVEEVGRPVLLWLEASFTLQQTFAARGLLGEKYLLTNLSQAPMVIAEQEFYKEGVLGVAVENLNLQPGDSTNVYVIRAGGQ
jgi:conjugal transfer pilus assembly protein TraK